MASHSQSSSLDNDYYASYLHSSSSSLTNNSFSPHASHSREPSQSQALDAGRKQASLAQISVPSFSEFRSHASSIPNTSPSAVKRKALPQPSSRVVSSSSRPLSLDSPLPHHPSGLSNVLTPPLTEDFAARQEDRSSYGLPRQSHDRSQSNLSIDSRILGTDASSSYSASRRSSIPIHERYAQEQALSHAPRLSASSVESTSQYSVAQGLNASPMNGVRKPSLQLDGVQRSPSKESLSSAESQSEKKPKSPGGKIGNFFGWKSQRPPTDSPTATMSDSSLSPVPSSDMAKPPIPMDAPAVRSPPPPSPRQVQYFDNPDAPILLGTPETNAHVKELERELSQVSSELAGSIRREMDLEDEIERLRSEIPSATGSELGRRGSDYFSDSGASSVRYPITDPEGKIDQTERQLRKAEQEKAQVKIEMASRLQTELGRRADLEQMVQRMEEQLQKRFDEEDEKSDLEGRVEELESTLEDTRRLLSQERQAKDSFEDLYSATKEELKHHKNERDNLRDEVVPQLKARVDGLENDATDTQALVYENTRMQQELSTLKERAGGRFGAIAEENDGSFSGMLRSGLARSGSLVRSGSKRGGSLTRSGSVKDRPDGGRARSGSLSGNITAEGIKDIEDQRDALHKALKLLINRHERQQKEHERAIKKLTSAKQKAELLTPNRSAYHKEVAFLKEEVTTLRKRTEDALEQKFQYEKGLSGIKMDLDRAEQETRGLRNILQEHDILAPSPRRLSFGEQVRQNSVDGNLELTISSAESERDQARQIATEYRLRASTAKNGSSAQLINSANRMDELANELEKQVHSNVDLRKRLSAAVYKGEREHKESSGKIEEMQKRLAGMEDSVLAAQQHSESTLGNHEAEVRRIEEASSPALQRLTIDIPDPTRLSPTSPLRIKSPRGLGSKKLSETSLLEMSRTQTLERKVRELEGLLREAEQDMQEVVQRVNASQLEVAELQTERDAALTQMRKLQGLIVEEREKAEALMP